MIVNSGNVPIFRGRLSQCTPVARCGLGGDLARYSSLKRSHLVLASTGPSVGVFRLSDALGVPGLDHTFVWHFMSLLSPFVLFGISRIPGTIAAPPSSLHTGITGFLLFLVGYLHPFVTWLVSNAGVPQHSQENPDDWFFFPLINRVRCFVSGSFLFLVQSRFLWFCHPGSSLVLPGPLVAPCPLRRFDMHGFSSVFRTTLSFLSFPDTISPVLSKH